MGRRTNYSFEKRQKEIKRAKKKQEKLEARRARKEAGATGDEDPASEETDDVETGEQSRTGTEPA